MKIHKNFSGGNIQVLRQADDRIELAQENRDTEGEWFYWAFCVEGAQGKTVTFDFGERDYIGYFGPAISRDLVKWSWTSPAEGEGSDHTRSQFTYTFGLEDTRVYFAHSFLYQPPRFANLARKLSLPVRTLARSRADRSMDIAEFGRGSRTILMTARHHACESTGNYVLEGVLEELAKNPPEGYVIATVPFLDIDGVISGDQGKCRIPHDHYLDYVSNPIYPETKAVMEYINNHDVAFAFDFHSPWHIGGSNDRVFIVRNRDDHLSRYEKFGALLEEETAACTDAFRYFIRDDLGNNVDWNVDGVPDFPRYFHRFPRTELSLILETAYFGTSQNQVSEERLLNLGRCFGRCIWQYTLYQ